MAVKEEQLLGLKKVAERLDCSLSKVRKLIYARRIDFVRIDRRVTVPLSEVERLIAEGRVSRRDVA